MGCEGLKTARDNVLIHGLIDWVSLSSVHSDVLQENPDRPLAEVRSQTFSLVRSLLEDGLFEAGTVTRKQGFVGWDTPLDESIQRIYDMYITNFGDDNWPWGVWLKLTKKGRPVARRVDGVGNARDDVLRDGLSGEVDLGSVHWYVKQDHPKTPFPESDGETLSEVQNESLSLVRSLLNEGLFEVGDFSDKSGDFVAWDTPLDESMKRIYKLYVTYFREKLGWPYEVWLKLTDKGLPVARAVEVTKAKGSI